MGTAACRTTFLTGSGAVLSMDATITSTSGLPAGQSVAKCSRTRTPFLSYAVTGHTLPEIQHTKKKSKVTTTEIDRAHRTLTTRSHLSRLMFLCRLFTNTPLLMTHVLKACFDACPFFCTCCDNYFQSTINMFTTKTNNIEHSVFSSMSYVCSGLD